jgi:hypothetical protein
MSVLKFNHMKTLRAARDVSQEDVQPLIERELREFGLSFSRERLARIESQRCKANEDEAVAIAKVLSRIPVRALGRRVPVTVADLGLVLDPNGSRRGRRPKTEVPAVAAAG